MMKLKETEVFVKTEYGRGNLNFVLIHNAGGNHEFFTYQIETLKKHGNVICLDLPGHGESKGISSYQMHDLSSTVKQICEQLSLTNICLIGLNNGAAIVIDLVLNNQLPIQQIILIDPPIFMDKSFVAEINGFIHQLEHEDTHQFVNTLVNALFIQTSPRNKEIAANAFNRVDKKALQNIFKGLIEWDAEAIGKLKKITCPALCILTDEHHCTYNKIRQEGPQFEIGKVIGSKCWATLEVPDQVNAMIERFIMLNS